MTIIMLSAEGFSDFEGKIFSITVIFTTRSIICCCVMREIKRLLHLYILLDFEVTITNVTKHDNTRIICK